MTEIISQSCTKRVCYEVRELIGPGCGTGIAGFAVDRYQPYPAGMGVRLSAPIAGSEPLEGFTEVVQVADGLHAVIADWKAGGRDAERGIWAESGGAGYAWFYFGADGDGRLEVEGWGTARRRGPTCSLTLTPPGSTYLWQNQPPEGRRGVSVAVHAHYLQENYTDLLSSCRHSLAAWLANQESRLRDFDIPLSPVMSSVTASLLNLPLEGRLRHRFVSATVEQLLCLALSGLMQLEQQRELPIHVSARDRAALREVRAALDRRLADPPRIDDLARQVGLNRNKLRFAFKEMFGLGISDYIHEKRMSAAYERLAIGIESVSEIAASVGYAHLSSFTAAFTRQFGRPPSLMRRTAAQPSSREDETTSTVAHS